MSPEGRARTDHTACECPFNSCMQSAPRQTRAVRSLRRGTVLMRRMLEEVPGHRRCTYQLPDIRRPEGAVASATTGCLWPTRVITGSVPSRSQMLMSPSLPPEASPPLGNWELQQKVAQASHRHRQEAKKTEAQQGQMCKRHAVAAVLFLYLPGGRAMTVET